jgi:hypothetical protein
MGTTPLPYDNTCHKESIEPLGEEGEFISRMVLPLFDNN